jgi:hypothetical protein
MKPFLAFFVAAWLIPAVAIAQDWKVYPYPDAGFAVQFPVPPTMESGTYKTPSGMSLPMVRYRARQEGIVFTLEIVDFSGVNADDASAISETERSFSSTGRVTVAIDARINREYGRELSVTGTDGSRSAVAIFFINKHLYRLVGKSLPPDAIARSGDAIRFQQSLQFIGPNEGFRGFGCFGGRGRFTHRFGPTTAMP